MSEPQDVPLDVLLVLPSLRAGGAEKHVLRLLQHFDRRRIRPRLAVHAAVGPLVDQIPEEVPWTTLCPGKPHSALLRALRSRRPLRRLILQTQPPVVCAFQELAAMATHGARPGCPWVASVQNTLSVKQATRRGLSAKLFFSLIRRALRRANHLVAASQGVADDVASFLGNSELPPLTTIHNAGFDSEPPGTSQSSLPSDAPQPPGPLLVACGRLVAQKDHATLLEALRRLPRSDVHLWIVGEGPLRPQLERQVVEFKLQDRVWLAGFRPDPRPFLTRADLFVASSRYEGFGNVLVEALACGTPVVSTDCPHGPAEIVEPGVSGLLVPPGNPEALADALAAALEDPARTARWAVAARERAERFHPQRAAEAYSRLFETLARNGSTAETVS